MKIFIIKLKIIFFLFFFLTNSFSQDKIVYVDMNVLINNSKAGISINKQMQKLIDNNNKEYEKIEKKLLKEEDDILKKKNILDPEKYNQEIITFKNKIANLRKERKEKVSLIRNKNVKAKNDLVNHVTKILAEYSSKNEITLVLNKDGIILGKKNIDVTEKILELLNKKVQNIKLTN
jgi:outer membrane protein